MKKSRNLAARAAHWSAEHRKTAIFGWLAFVVVAVLLGNAVGKNEIHGADQFSGEAGRAEQTLYDSGLRPNDRARADPEQRARRSGIPSSTRRSEQATRQLSQTQYVRNVMSPLTGDAPVSVDQHSALVQFDITGDDLEARDRLEPAEETISAVAADHPDLRVEQFGSVSSNKELNETFASDLAQAELLSLPLTLLILVIAFGSLVAALVPLLLGVTHRDGRARPDRASEPPLPDRQQHLVGHPPDRAGRQRRLLALLPAPRARGAGRRAQRAHARSRSPPPRPGAPC